MCRWPFAQYDQKVFHLHRKIFTFRVEIDSKKYLFIFYSLLESASIYIKIFEFSKTTNKVLIDLSMIRSIRLTKFLIGSVISDFHLIWLISHWFWLESVVQPFLYSDVYNIILIMLSNSIETYLLTVDSNNFLTIPEEQNIILKVFWIKRSLFNEIFELLFFYESCFLKQWNWIVIFLEGNSL